MSYNFDWIENNIIVTYEGEVNYEDISHVDGKIFGNSRFDLMTYAIYDFSKVNSFKIIQADIEVFSALNQSASRWNKSLKLACITQDKIINDAISNFINFMKESNWEIRIFSELEKAMEWVEKHE